MSDYPYNAGYDAGAVVDMNNLAIGYFPRSLANCAMPMQQARPAPVQAQPQPAVPAEGSETSSEAPPGAR
jgi:hypothetical protein